MITTGSCKYQIDLVDYDVKEGDILFIPPLFLHSITDECNEKMVSDTYVFHLNFLGEIPRISVQHDISHR